MIVNRDSSEFKTVESSDLGWKLSGKTVDDHQSIPSWTASNAFLSEQNMPVATVVYVLEPVNECTKTVLFVTFIIRASLVDPPIRVPPFGPGCQYNQRCYGYRCSNIYYIPSHLFCDGFYIRN